MTTALLIVDGSRTERGTDLTERVADKARERGFAPQVVDLESLTPGSHSEAVHVLVIVPAMFDAPESAAQTAEPVGPPSSDVTDSDVRIDQILAALTPAPTAPTAPPEPTPAARPRPRRSPWNRKNPYPAEILSNRVLSGPESDKEVRHIVISLGDSGIEYEPGDGISVSPTNDPALVELLLQRLDATGDEVIADRRAEYSLREALTSRYEISTASKYLVEYIATRTGDPELTHLIATGDHEALDAWLWGRDVLDLLDIDPSLNITGPELLAELTPLAHRVYSISSSPQTHPGTVHLTMSTVRYRTGDRVRGGTCSTHLADRLAEGDTVGVFITPNKTFRLPADDVATIMIGPGTGIAPFRAFLNHRAALGAGGRNWLFFGDRHRDQDFLYADELATFVDDALLQRLDVAFSRDQEHKVYVQDHMRAHGAELFEWIESGAHIYVCGDATRMAPDVDEALHEIVAEHGGLDTDAAQDYITALKDERRYLRDVY